MNEPTDRLIKKIVAAAVQLRRFEFDFRCADSESRYAAEHGAHRTYQRLRDLVDIMPPELRREFERMRVT